MRHQGWVRWHDSLAFTDRVCRLYFLGSQIPFILRHDFAARSAGGQGRTTYKLVGECYMHGMMDGEMMASHEKTQDFEIT